MAVRKTFFAETVSMNFVMAGTIAFPINYWMVAKHLKHGCMTLPGADKPEEGSMDDVPDTGAGGDDAMDMEMKTLPLGQQLFWIGFSFVVFFACCLLASLWVPIKFQGRSGLSARRSGCRQVK